GAGQPERDPLDQVRAEQLAAPGRSRLRHLAGARVHGLRRTRRARGRGLAAGAAAPQLRLRAIIPAMQPLRSARFLARLVLAWFVLVVGAAAAAPLLQGPSGLQVICSGGSMQLVDVGDEDGRPSPVATLDCPLCVAAVPPPPTVTVASPPPAVLP